MHERMLWWCWELVKLRLRQLPRLAARRRKVCGGTNGACSAGRGGRLPVDAAAGYDPGAVRRRMFGVGCLASDRRYATMRAFWCAQEEEVANIKSQVKRIRTAERQRQRNKAVRSELKTEIRKFNQAQAGGDKDAAAGALQVASRKLDKATSKGVIHKNNAANKKSAMAKKLGAM